MKEEGKFERGRESNEMQGYDPYYVFFFIYFWTYKKETNGIIMFNRAGPGFRAEEK